MGKQEHCGGACGSLLGVGLIRERMGGAALSGEEEYGFLIGKAGHVVCLMAFGVIVILFCRKGSFRVVGGLVESSR